MSKIVLIIALVIAIGIVCERAYERQNRRGNQSKYTEDEKDC